MSLSNLLYPDNPKRLHRANELMYDIDNLSRSTSNTKKIIDTKLENLKEKLEAAADKINIPKDQVNKLTIETDPESTIVLLIPKTLEFLFAIPIGKFAYRRAALTYLLKTGKIGKAAFSRLVGFSMSARIVGLLAFTGAAIGVSVGIELIIGAIEGSNDRDELQKGKKLHFILNLYNLLC